MDSATSLSLSVLTVLCVTMYFMQLWSQKQAACSTFRPLVNVPVEDGDFALKGIVLYLLSNLHHPNNQDVRKMEDFMSPKIWAHSY